MSEKEYDSLSKALMSLYAPLGDIEAEQDMLNERSRGAERIPEGEDMSQYSNVPVKTPDAVVKMLEIEGGLASLPKAIPKKVDLNTVAVAPTPEQIADANTPRLGDKIDLIKKRESVGDTNYLQKGETKKPKEAVEDKQNNNIINYDSGLIYNKDTNIYSSSDPRMNALISVESSGKHTIKDKINVPGGDVTDLKKARGITQLKPTSFSDLKGEKKYARNFSKSYSVDEIDNPETNYIIGEQYLKSLFKDFKNLGYSEDDAQDLGYIAYNQGYQAVVDWLSGTSKLKKEGQEYIGKINKVLGIDRSIKDRTEYKKIKKKQSGGMIESNPYKREPRFI